MYVYSKFSYFIAEAMTFFLTVSNSFFFLRKQKYCYFLISPLLSPCELHYSLIGAGPPSILKKLFYFGLCKAS